MVSIFHSIGLDDPNLTPKQTIARGITPIHVMRLGLSAKKHEYVSLKFKIVFPSYLGAMKTKTLVCFISTKNMCFNSTKHVRVLWS